MCIYLDTYICNYMYNAKREAPALAFHPAGASSFRAALCIAFHTPTMLKPFASHRSVF